jgi:glycosyltransferase involved in cell wall biosynthesis
LLTPEYCVGVSDGFVDYLRLFREADGICCISESVMKDVEALMKSVLREKAGPLLSFSHLGANFVESHAGPENALAPLILSVGTIEPRKNQIQLLRAAHVLRQRGLKFKVVFVGNPGWKSDEFYAELSRLDPHQEFASIRYSVSDRELDQLYRQCRFSVFCSHFEGFGLPILESLHYGKPVITSPIGSMKEVADRFGGCVLVSPNDLSGMVEAMALLLSNDAELAKLAASIRQVRAATWAEYADRVFEVMGRC